METNPATIRELSAAVHAAARMVGIAKEQKRYQTALRKAMDILRDEEGGN